MNKVILMGRLTRDPDVRYSPGDNATAIARYTLAVDRRFSGKHENNGGQSADFIGCVAFGKGAEFAGKYLHQGTRVLVTGRIQTGSYVNRDGQKVYTTDVVIEDQEFAKSRSVDSSAGTGENRTARQGLKKSEPDGSGFMKIPEGIDVDTPFS